jgi:sortase A
MTATPALRERRDVRPRRTWSPANLVVAVVVFAGIVTLVYPTAADWFSDLAHASEISGYVHDVAGKDAAALQQLRSAAQTYNQHLPNGPLRDPYLLNASGSSESVEAGRATYDSLLSTGSDSPMARVRIPSIDVDLPVYHGTDDATLAKGIGHLYGSALPVGGLGSHAVLTGHSGLPNATLFTHLDEMRKGDLFYIDVAGEELTYRVDRIEVVKPNDGDDLRQVPGHDYVTLLTCTPTGVNTHRLLVRGERVPDARSSAAEAVAPPPAPGIPWWIAAVVGGAGIAGLIGWPRRGRR